MRRLFAALVGLVLALLHPWGMPSCDCVSEEVGPKLIAACCCDHDGLGGPCAPLVSVASTVAEQSPLPAPSSAALAAPVASALRVGEGLRLDRRLPLARGPPGLGPPVWLQNRTIRL